MTDARLLPKPGQFWLSSLVVNCGALIHEVNGEEIIYFPFHGTPSNLSKKRTAALSDFIKTHYEAKL